MHSAHMITQVALSFEAGPTFVAEENLLFIFRPVGDLVFIEHPKLFKAFPALLAGVRPKVEVDLLDVADLGRL